MEVRRKKRFMILEKEVAGSKIRFDVKTRKEVGWFLVDNFPILYLSKNRLIALDSLALTKQFDLDEHKRTATPDF